MRCGAGEVWGQGEEGEMEVSGDSAFGNTACDILAHAKLVV